jgi:hypothetical protein
MMALDMSSPNERVTRFDIASQVGDLFRSDPRTGSVWLCFPPCRIWRVR